MGVEGVYFLCRFEGVIWWGEFRGLVPDLEIVYKMTKPRKLRQFSKKVFAEAHQLRKAMQADETSQRSSPTAPSVSQSCVACAGLIPRDWPRRFQYCRLGWHSLEESASMWGKAK